MKANDSKLSVITQRCVMVILIGLSALLSACSSPLSTVGGRGDVSERLQRVPGGLLRLDAAFEANAVEIFDEKGQLVMQPSLLSPKSVAHLSIGGSGGMPSHIRVTWRTGNYSTDVTGRWTGGTVIGNHMVPVAERIPDEVLDYIRKNGGALRLKIRLVPNGVLIGWDVEKIVSMNGWKPGDGATGIFYYAAGGDFREAEIFNGKVVRPGWYIDPITRKKIDTDF